MNIKNSVTAAANSCSNLDLIGFAARAGTPVASGLPDFRGNERLWNTYRPIKGHEKAFSDLIDPIEFTNNLGLCGVFRMSGELEIGDDSP